ncbi:MAG: DJ-1 family protein, partial [Halanaerobium sp. MSAO_Bac5]
MGKVLIPLADGFEEIEAVSNIDVLRRAGLEVITAGIGGREIRGDHDIKV